MPERKGYSRFDTESVQGEGSFVIVRSRTVGEILMTVRQQEKQKTVLFRLGAWLGQCVKRLFPARFQSQYIGQRDWAYRVISYIDEWNWVDAQGQPLQQPKEDLKVVEQLTSNELACLIDCVFGNQKSVQQKN